MKQMKYGLLCFVLSILLLLFYDSLPDQIATHFNFYGNADLVSNKWVIIVLVPMLGFLMHIGYMLILEKKPEWIGKRGSGEYSFLYIPILTCGMVMFLLWNSW